MFCVHCGASGAAAFCSSCGKSQVAETKSDPRLEVSDVDWDSSLDYDRLLRQPEARSRIAAAGKSAFRGITSEDFLAIFDAVSPIGISMQKVTDVLIPIYDKMGFNSQRCVQRSFLAPAGRTLLAVLCSMAAKSCTIANAEQDQDNADLGCRVFATIAGNVITNPGTMTATLRAIGERVDVRLDVKIAGQVYDWGRCQRLLNDMMTRIGDDLSSQMNASQSRQRRVA